MQTEVVQVYSGLVGQILGFGYVLVILLGPIILGVVFIQSYFNYKRNKFIAEKKKDAVLLELTPPREILKSPLAMELFLISLYQTSGETTWIDTTIRGKARAHFSIEIASLGGEIKFFIWTWDFWKPIVTSFLYAQYPEITVKEVADYAAKIHFNPKVNDIFGTQFLLTKPDYYPIKSYNDYNLGDDPKEEFKVDPTTPFFEYLSLIKPGEEIWFQIILRSHKSDRQKPGTWFQKVDWKHFAAEEVLRLKQKDVQSAGEIKITGTNLSKGEREVIEAIERNVSKLAYDTVIRTIYIAPKERFNPLNIVGLIGCLRQYNTGHLNSFTVDKHHITTFDYPWQDIWDLRANYRKTHIMHYYQDRAAFYPPQRSHCFTLSTESIATMYHFPTQTASTPTITRTEAKKAEPPSNLPI